MSFGPGFQTRFYFDPVAIAWAFIAAGVFEAIRYRRQIMTLLSQKHVIAIAGGVALAGAVIGLSVELSISRGFNYAYVWMILVAIGGLASIIVQNHPRFSKPITR
jgi:hypothetical protein